MFIPRIMSSLCFTVTTVSAIEVSCELPELTPEGFNKILDQVVFPQDMDMSPYQARMVNKPKEDFFTFRFTERDFLDELLPQHNIQLPKPFACDENFNIHLESKKDKEELVFNGLMNISAKDYEFNLTFYVFNDPNISAKEIHQDGKSRISPNVMDRLGYFYYDDKAARERRQNLAGIVECSWKKKGDQRTLVINRLEVYPYIFNARGLFRIDGLMTDLKFEGLYKRDFNLRANRIYDTLNLLGRDILGAQAIVIKKEAVHPIVLGNLTTPVDKEDVFKEKTKDNKGTGIYELKLGETPRNSVESSSENSESEGEIINLESGEEEFVRVL